MSAQTGLLFWNPDTLTSSFKVYVSFDLFEIIKKSSCFAQLELFSGWLEKDSLITWQRQSTSACLGVFTKFQPAHLHGCPRYLVLQRLWLGWRFTVQPTMSGSVARIAELASSSKSSLCGLHALGLLAPIAPGPIGTADNVEELSTIKILRNCHWIPPYPLWPCLPTRCRNYSPDRKIRGLHLEVESFQWPNPGDSHRCSPHPSDCHGLPHQLLAQSHLLPQSCIHKFYTHIEIGRSWQRSRHWVCSTSVLAWIHSNGANKSWQRSSESHACRSLGICPKQAYMTSSIKIKSTYFVTLKGIANIHYNPLLMGIFHKWLGCITWTTPKSYCPVDQQFEACKEAFWAIPGDSSIFLNTAKYYISHLTEIWRKCFWQTNQNMLTIFFSQPHDKGLRVFGECFTHPRSLATSIYNYI